MKKMTRKNEIVMTAISAKVEAANKELKEITAKGFPFVYSDVELGVTADEGGVYVRSGVDPIVVAEWPKRFDREAEESVIRTVQHSINEEVRAIRTSAANRGSISDEAKALEKEGEEALAATEAIKAAGLDPAKYVDPGVSDDVKDQVYKAAKEAVKEANKGLAFHIIGTSRKYGTERMTIRRMQAGFIVSAAGKPCIVTHWPKLGQKVDGMIRHIVGIIASCAESRRAYFARMAEVAREEERLRREAELAEAAELAVAQF